MHQYQSTHQRPVRPYERRASVSANRLNVDAERVVAVYRALMDIADEGKIISDDDLVTVVEAVNEAAILEA
jgi:hypothetical protein